MRSSEAPRFLLLAEPEASLLHRKLELSPGIFRTDIDCGGPALAINGRRGLVPPRRPCYSTQRPAIGRLPLSTPARCCTHLAVARRASNTAMIAANMNATEMVPARDFSASVRRATTARRTAERASPALQLIKRLHAKFHPVPGTENDVRTEFTAAIVSRFALRCFLTCNG
jgi:hypothetical protein